MLQFIFDQHKRGEARRGSAGSCLQHYHLKKVCEVECGEYLDILKIIYVRTILTYLFFVFLLRTNIFVGIECHALALV